MKIRNIYNFINKIAPFNTAFNYDNVGLQVGGMESSVTSVLLALDCTNSVLDMAKKIGADLIITHHPIIFNPLKALTSDTIPFKLATAGISLISAHTNLDVAQGGVNDCLCEKLGLQNSIGFKALPEGRFEARMGYLKSNVTADELAELVKNVLNIPFVKYTNGKNNIIKKLAVCSGSGGDLLHEAVLAGADAFVTSDVKHSVFVEADQLGFTLIDAGHFETEIVVIEPLKNKLSDEFPDVKFFAYNENEISYK